MKSKAESLVLMSALNSHVHVRVVRGWGQGQGLNQRTKKDQKKIKGTTKPLMATWGCPFNQAFKLPKLNLLQRIEQPGFEPGFSECQLDVPTSGATLALALEPIIRSKTCTDSFSRFYPGLSHNSNKHHQQHKVFSSLVPRPLPPKERGSGVDGRSGYETKPFLAHQGLCLI